jgi:glycosyltransferase involved in cell wall biosynthesis
MLTTLTLITMNDIKISVALCTYNGEKYLREQLDSLFNQTLKPDEIIVSDDMSTDSTLTILREYEFKDISILFRILDNQQKRGVFNNFPYVISQCKGDIIFTCDQDDYWLPTKIQKHMQVHEKASNIDLVFSNADVVSNNINNYLYPLWEKNSIVDYKNGQASFASLVIKGRSIAGCCMSFKKILIYKILPFPKEIYHDDWIATNACLVGEIRGINESLIKYRQHSDNAVGIVRGGKLSFYKSLFTNAAFYVKSDMYIYTRHKKIYTALSKSELTSNLVDKYNLMSNLDFYKARSQYGQCSILKSMKALTYNFMCNRYRYHHGFFTYLKDIYNLLYVKIFRDKLKS